MSTIASLRSQPAYVVAARESSRPGCEGAGLTVIWRDDGVTRVLARNLATSSLVVSRTTLVRLVEHLSDQRGCLLFMMVEEGVGKKKVSKSDEAAMMGQVTFYLSY